MYSKFALTEGVKLYINLLFSVSVSLMFSTPARGRDSAHKGVSLRGKNFGFWSHLGCSGQNTIIFSREGLVQGCT